MHLIFCGFGFLVRQNKWTYFITVWKALSFDKPEREHLFHLEHSQEKMRCCASVCLLLPQVFLQCFMGLILTFLAFLWLFLTLSPPDLSPPPNSELLLRFQVQELLRMPAGWERLCLLPWWGESWTQQEYKNRQSWDESLGLGPSSGRNAALFSIPCTWLVFWVVQSYYYIIIIIISTLPLCNVLTCRARLIYWVHIQIDFIPKTQNYLLYKF